MSQPTRHIDRLKVRALEMGLSKDEVREFGLLTKRETWEKAIAFRDATTRVQWKELDAVDNVTHSIAQLSHPLNLSDQINFPQFIALFLAAVGFFALLAPTLRGVNLLPIKITVQIGTKL